MTLSILDQCKEFSHEGNRKQKHVWLILANLMQADCKILPIPSEGPGMSSTSHESSSLMLPSDCLSSFCWAMSWSSFLLQDLLMSSSNVGRSEYIVHKLASNWSRPAYSFLSQGLCCYSLFKVAICTGQVIEKFPLFSGLKRVMICPKTWASFSDQACKLDVYKESNANCAAFC